ncbi:uncharacterized protein ACMZJ9_004566, partial [Mantella aurantiaca]
HQNTPDHQEASEPQKTPDHLETSGPQKTPDHLETPGSLGTPDPQGTSEPHKTPGTPDFTKTTAPQKTPYHQEISEPHKTTGPQKTSGSQMTPGSQETPVPQKTPDHQESSKPQDTSGSQVTPDHQETLGSQKTLGLQNTPGSQKTRGPQNTPGSQKTLGPQNTPGSLKTLGPQNTLGSQKTSGPQNTPESQKTSSPQGTPGSQKTSGPQNTPGSQKTSGPQNTPGSQKTSGPQNTPGSQKTSSPQGTPGSQKTSGHQATPDPQKTLGFQSAPASQETSGSQKNPCPQEIPGPGTQQSENPEEALSSSQLRISQCDYIQPVPWTTPIDGLTQAGILEDSPPLPLTAVLIPCHQREPCDSSAAAETSIADTIQSSAFQPDSCCVFSANLPDFDTSELCPVITDTPFTDNSDSPDLSKPWKADPSVSKKSGDSIEEEKINDSVVTSNSCKGGDINETLANGTRGVMAPCTLTNIGITDDALPDKDPQSDSPEFQAAGCEEESLLKIPVLLQTEGRNIPDSGSHEGKTSMGMTNVSRLEAEKPQVPEWEQRSVTEPPASPRLTGTDQRPPGGKEDVSLPHPETEPPGGAETIPELPDSQLLGALEESLYLDKNVGDAASVPVTSSSSVRGKAAFKTPHTCLLTNETSAGTSTGQQERREEDASSTVQGLILELSNLNRLIMTTYRDLRQKRARFPPARGAAGKRRREM